MTKVLFVCLGNICRSPMAEAIFRDKVNRAGLNDAISCDSCGTAHYHIGNKPDRRTIKVLQQHGIETQHLGRQFKYADFDAFDFIFPMDKTNLSDILALAKTPHQKAKVRLMRDFDNEKSAKDVPDPYYGNSSDFEKVFEILDTSTGNLLESLRNKLEIF